MADNEHIGAYIECCIPETMIPFPKSGRINHKKQEIDNLN